MKNLKNLTNFEYDQLFKEWDSLLTEHINESNFTAEFDYHKGTATFIDTANNSIETIYNRIPNADPNHIDNNYIKGILGEKLYNTISNQIAKIVKSNSIKPFLSRAIKFFGKKKSVICAILLIVIMNIGLPSMKSMVDSLPLSADLKEWVYNVIGEKIEKTTKKIETKTDQLNDYLEKIGFKESSSDYTKINSLGYMGKYQFGEAALKDLGLSDTVKLKDFRKNPDIFPEAEQDQAMKDYLKLNAKYLGDYMNAVGRTIGGFKVTQSGLLAAAHLVGQKKVKIWIDSNGAEVGKDGNGVPLTEYLKNFGGYDISSLGIENNNSNK